MTTTVEVWQRNPPGVPTKVADITKMWDRKFRIPKNDYGVATVNVQLSDPELAELLPGRLVRFVRDGVGRAFVLGPRRFKTVSKSEEAEQVLSVQAPGVLSVLNDGKVQPHNGPGWLPWNGQRRWDYTNPLLDTSGWGTAVELWRQGDPVDLSSTTYGEAAQDIGRVGFNSPAGYTDGDSYWIWSSTYEGTSGTFGSGDLHMPPGTSYFSWDVTTAELMQAQVMGGADNYLEVAVDGVVLLTSSGDAEQGWSQSRDFTFPLSPGTHTIRVKATNVFTGVEAGNIAGLVLALTEVHPATGVQVSVLARTTDSWKALDYPATPPGFTAGQILLALLGELQALGFLTDITPTFDETLDSDGAAFPILTDVVTTVGDGLGEVVRQMCAAAIDTRMNADLTWDVWVKGTAGTASGVTYAAGVNIAELELDGDTTPVSSLLVLHQEGFSLLGDASSGRQDYLDLSQYPKAEALVRAQAELDDLLNERWSVAITVQPTTGDVPFDDVGIFDTATAPGPDGPDEVECIALSWAEDDAGNEIVTAEFGDVIRTPEERRAERDRMTSAGSLAGRSPLPPQSPGVVSGSPLGAGGGVQQPKVQTGAYPFHRDTAVTDTVSDPWPVDQSATVYEFAVSVPVPQGSDVDVILNITGTPAVTVTVPAGADFAQAVGLAFPVVKDQDSFTVECVDTGFSIVATVRVS